jgi:hypothetical protein
MLVAAATALKKWGLVPVDRTLTVKIPARFIYRTWEASTELLSIIISSPNLVLVGSIPALSSSSVKR